MSESIPQLAGFLALRRIWPEMIDGWAAPGALESLPAAARLLAAGADRDDVIRLARCTAYEAVFAMLYRLTGEGRDHEASEDTPGWVLMETTPRGDLTGRPVRGLYEDILTMDPSGRDGQDLFK
ncbi:hypothetical protein DPM19_19230 [Actinomadura craniellae]|uniref:Uncharacterized protein n=1 Tax=Actinomadura craniellae TaxID=2231787 RepID=A0A365H410_9ACTN|nr:hypothetical protein DPM19_19230 [Actinomadura craniellae]